MEGNDSAAFLPHLCKFIGETANLIFSTLQTIEAIYHERRDFRLSLGFCVKVNHVTSMYRARPSMRLTERRQPICQRSDAGLLMNVAAPSFIGQQSDASLSVNGARPSVHLTERGQPISQQGAAGLSVNVAMPAHKTMENHAFLMQNLAKIMRF